MLKTIIFDFDGTIADSLEIAITCSNRALKDMGCQELQFTNDMRHMTFKDIIKKHVNIPMYRLPALSKRVKKCLMKESHNIKLFPGWKRVLLHLKEKYEIGILTSNSFEVVQKVLGDEYLNLFSFIEVNTTVLGKHRALTKLLRLKNLDKAQIMYVGDERRDITACQKINVPIIAVTWGYNTKKSLQECNPTHLIDQPAQLLKIL